MSDPLSNSEIQDVLSSIRRLVSEDRRLRTQVPVAEADGGEGESEAGKLLLTDALRVVSPVAEAGETAEEVPVVNAVTEEEQDARWPVHVSQIPAAPTVRPASVLEEDLASLESTIAELEAAVAGIGAEFEPDGSEVAKDTADPSALALEEAFDDGFVVDTGGPVPVRPDDRSISAGVTEGAAPAPEAEEVADEVAEPEEVTAAPAEAHGADEITFLHSGPAGRRSDWQVISGVMDRQDAPVGRLHLTARNAAEVSGADTEGADAVAEAADATEMTDAAPEAVAAGGKLAGDHGPEAETLELAEETLAAPEAPEEAFAASDADETAEAAFAGTASLDSPEAVDDVVAEADLPDTAEMAPEGDPMPAAAMAGAAAMAAEAADEGEEDGLDLFSQDDEAIIDMEMLRDLISDVIREELQGPLGERITRNVRKLVRQEIARALEAQKFE